MCSCATTPDACGSMGCRRLPGPPAGPDGLVQRTEATGRVLYIDDDEVNRLLMQALLDFRPGVTLQLAADGSCGIAAACANPPDLVLLDMRLPDMSGLQVLQQLRAVPALAGVPCVAVSANAMPDDIADALAKGFDAYITKPIARSQLFAEVDRWLAARAG